MSEIRRRIVDTFHVQDPSTKHIYIIHRIKEYAVLKHGEGEMEVPGTEYLNTDGGDGVNDLGNGVFSIPALGINVTVLN